LNIFKKKSEEKWQYIDKRSKKMPFPMEYMTNCSYFCKKMLKWDKNPKIFAEKLSIRKVMRPFP